VIGCTFFGSFLYASKEMNVNKKTILFIYTTSFFCLPKRRSKKKAPGCAVPTGCLALLAVDGTLKTHRLRRFRQVQRHFPPTAVMLSGTEWVYKVKT